MYALLAPHLEGRGSNNSGFVAETSSGRVLVANRGSSWLALGATVPFRKCSCGYVGVNDGWTDIVLNRRAMSWEFDHVLNGNIALTGELDVSAGPEFVLGLAFGDTLNSALVTLRESLSFPFRRPAGVVDHSRLALFLEQWQRSAAGLLPANLSVTGDGGRLYRASRNILLAHEDKVYDGALIASLSIPWGEYQGDEDDPGKRSGGYHLVWTRDMCNSATALLASGQTDAPLRSLIYLAGTQLSDGGFHQNFYINGDTHSDNVQLDEIAFPVLLARRLARERALEGFDPYPMVLKAAGALVAKGPITPQERWEENPGYSPSTLASNIAALVCAAAFARERDDRATEAFLLDYADFLEAHVEVWTVAAQGSPVAGIPKHYIRILPTDGDPDQMDVPINSNRGILKKAREVIDAGFLELVRYGIRKAGEPLFEDSLRVVDAVIKVEFAAQGPGYHRYNFDGYGQHDDGGPWRIGDPGRGGTWPLLTGERGHYELAAGRDPRPYIRAMERFAISTGLLAEQLWDRNDLPQAHMFNGRPSGAAMPLAWAHAEYVKLVRSAADGKVFDQIPEVADRYLAGRAPGALEVWNFSRQLQAVARGRTLRFALAAPFRLRWTVDDWQHTTDTPSTPTAVGVEYADVAVAAGQRAPIRFTFFWLAAGRWEGRDFQVDILP